MKAPRRGADADGGEVLVLEVHPSDPAHLAGVREGWALLKVSPSGADRHRLNQWLLENTDGSCY